MACSLHYINYNKILEEAETLDELDKNIETYHRRHGR